jgi:outer membrane immunogenic protein
VSFSGRLQIFEQPYSIIRAISPSPVLQRQQPQAGRMVSLMLRGTAVKKLAIAITVGLIGTPAFAADTAVKAPPPVPAPVYNWTARYVGGNVGDGWGDARTNIVGNGTNTIDPGGPFATLLSQPATFAGSHSEGLEGIIGGGQAGHNYQVNPR